MIPPSAVIQAKRDGLTISSEELGGFFGSYLAGGVPDYQMSAFLMAVYFRGMDREETDALVECMLGSGRRLDLSRLPGPRVDKHSTGGVGDKVSLALAPLAAAAGLFVPMMSGRGLGHTAGTLDKLEAIPGFRTTLELGEFADVLERVGCAMIGQTREIAPLDRRLYALRDVTATVPSIPLIAASIMSKKLAEDLDGLLLDVKVGEGAFIRGEEDALALAELMVDIGAQRGLATRALLTAMDRPLGVAIGNGLETIEAIACLRGEGPEDLERLVVTQVGEMVSLAEPEATPAAVEARVREALSSGAALERFTRLVEAQGGDPGVVDDPSRLRTAPHRLDVRARDGGVVLAVTPRILGEGVVRLGGGRTRMDEAVDPGVGFEVVVRPGDEVAAGDRLGLVHARDAADAALGAEILLRSVSIGPEGSPVSALPLVLRSVGPRRRKDYG